jgi:hypothetical protein
VPHLRDGLIVDKVGHFRGSENPDTLTLPIPKMRIIIAPLQLFFIDSASHPKKRSFLRRHYPVRPKPTQM